VPLTVCGQVADVQLEINLETVRDALSSAPKLKISSNVSGLEGSAAYGVLIVVDPDVRAHVPSPYQHRSRRGDQLKVPQGEHGRYL
jgi:hypothetical protein